MLAIDMLNAVVVPTTFSIDMLIGGFFLLAAFIMFVFSFRVTAPDERKALRKKAAWVGALPFLVAAMTMLVWAATHILIGVFGKGG